MPLDPYLDAAGQATLRALLDTLIPPDEFPGAWDAGVGEYLARQFGRDLKDRVAQYQSGLRLLDDEARLACGCTFDQANLQQRTGLIAALERGNARTDWPFAAAAFIGMVIDHAHEGYYADPGNGGNSGAVAWRMISFDVRG